jgi:hypothetical protein
MAAPGSRLMLIGRPHLVLFTPSTEVVWDLRTASRTRPRHQIGLEVPNQYFESVFGSI